MKLVYTHPNIAMVVQAQGLIEHASIECELRNQYASGAIGELAPINAWPEVWVAEDRHLERAAAIVKKMQEPVRESDWRCGNCENLSPATFDSCWHCGEDKLRSPESGVSRD